jgi:formiminotetrahydrofolate cyclodeaminase
MSSASKLVDLSLSAFADRLAERTPTPGGGSLAAYLAASGAAAVSMAFRFTSGERFAAVQAAQGARAAELDRLRARAIELVDADSAAYELVQVALALPKSNELEKTARSAAMQAGLKRALEVPLETMAVAAQALGVARAGATSVNPNVASDCGAGAHALWAALEGARANVRLNAASIKDAGYVAEQRARAASLAEPARAAREAIVAALEPHFG